MTRLRNNAVYFTLYYCFSRFDVSSPIVSSSLSPAPSDEKLDPPITIITMNDKVSLVPPSWLGVNCVAVRQTTELHLLFLIASDLSIEMFKNAFFPSFSQQTWRPSRNASTGTLKSKLIIRYIT